MAQKHFIIINVETKRENVTERLRPLLDRAVDWIEVSPLSWLAWTSSSSRVWLERLKTSSIEFKSIFVSELDTSDQAGEMPKSFWAFIQKYEQDA